MRFVSLFSGIGGFELGISQAASMLGINSKCVFASEIDKRARQIYINHFGADFLYGDITQIHASDVPNHDLLCAGFPCQDVSLAGKRAGLQGARSGLFFNLLRIVREKTPVCLLLENVKGLLSSNGGWDFARILFELDELGYCCEWQVLNTANFGLPQDRRRVFIIGYLAASGRSRSQIFPLRQNGKLYYTSGEDQGKIHPVSSCLTSGGNDKWNGTYIVHSLASRSGDPLKGGTGQLSKSDGLSYCLTAWNHQALQHGSLYRRFTPLECERLMGFPDNWTAGVSDSARYRCLGNSVSVPVVAAVASRLLGVL